MIVISIIILQELKHYTFNQLKQKFQNINNKNLKKLLSKLKSNSILKSHKSNNSIKLGKLVDNSNYLTEIDEYDEFKTYTFHYVGILQVSYNTILIIYPKYLSDTSINNDFYKNNRVKLKQLLKVVENYENRLEQSITNSLFADNQMFNSLGAKIQVIKTFLENGLYQKEKIIENKDGNGLILWTKTVNESTVHLVNDVPIYFEIHARERVIDKDNIIRQLQCSILNQISNNFKTILDLLDIPEIQFDNVIDIEDYNSLYFIEILETELQNEFINKNRKIIEELLIYLYDYQNESENILNLFGTKSFNLVWEDVCRVVYSNHLNHTFRELNLLTPNPQDQDKKLKNYIEKPKWYDKLNNNIVEQDSTFILDIINVNDNVLNIYDAKYYNIYFDKRSVHSNPGINDISKQFLYQLCFKDIIKKNKLKTHNYFVIPKDDFQEDQTIIGTIEMKLFSDIGLNLIKVIGRDCVSIYNEYLKLL
ncbi:LlaJI family restriction endonuclease [Staphylococcus epidermidis]|nr:LlaJI family restriction endonuclease [Staphylococcus epidermidis]MCG1804066.1 LlaJI family restriction endonuclease [Staphylococcus epidermidis]MCG2422460.1 LlaJI family restriction endonuclease [Staphylococcus epidermidis]